MLQARKEEVNVPLAYASVAPQQACSALFPTEQTTLTIEPIEYASLPSLEILGNYKSDNSFLETVDLRFFSGSLSFLATRESKLDKSTLSI